MTLIIEVPDDLGTRLAVEASRKGRNLPEFVLGVLERSVEAPEPPPAAHPVLRLAQQVRESVPSEQWAALPADLSVSA